MSFLRKIYNRLVRFDEDGSLYSPRGVEQRVEKRLDVHVLTPSLRSTPYSPQTCLEVEDKSKTHVLHNDNTSKQLFIGSLMLEDIKRLKDEYKKEKRTI